MKFKGLKISEGKAKCFKTLLALTRAHRDTKAIEKARTKLNSNGDLQYDTRKHARSLSTPKGESCLLKLFVSSV